MTDAGEVRVELYHPGRVFAGVLTRYSGLKAEQLELGLETVSLDIDYTDPVLHIEYIKNSVTYTAFKNPVECTIDVYYRGDLFVSCVVTDYDDADDDVPGTTIDDIPITFSLQGKGADEYFLEGRTVKGVSGDRFSIAAAKPDDIAREMMRANCTLDGGAGYPIQPAYYSTNSIDREDFGSHVVAVGSDTGSHADTVDYRVVNNEPLIDEILSLCRQYDMKLTGSWSGSTRTTNIAVPGTGTDRTTGDNKVEFSRNRGTLIKWRRTGEVGREANVFEGEGKGSYQNRARGWAHDPDSIAMLGVRESGEGNPSGNADDAQAAADYMKAQLAGTRENHEVTVIEGPGAIWNDNFQRGDKVTVRCERRGIAEQKHIAKLVLHHPAPEPAFLEILFGRPPENEDRKSQRSGGGGSGSKRAGGRPKAKNGEPDAVRTITTQVGDDIVFDQVDDELDIYGESTDRIRARVRGIDNDDDEDSTEAMEIQVFGDYFAGCPTCTGYVKVWAANAGRVIYLLAHQSSDTENPPSDEGRG